MQNTNIGAIKKLLKRKAALEAELRLLEAQSVVCDAESELNSLLGELEHCEISSSSSDSQRQLEIVKKG